MGRLETEIVIYPKVYIDIAGERMEVPEETMEFMNSEPSITPPPAWDNGVRKESAMEDVKKIAFGLWAVMGLVGLVLTIHAVGPVVDRNINSAFCQR